MINDIKLKEDKNKLISNKLQNFICEAVNSLMTINQLELEYIVYKLLKSKKVPMTKLEIIDRLYFLKEIKIENLELILNYYNFIHMGKAGYYYSEEEKSIENNIFNIIYKIKYIEGIDICTLVCNLLSKMGKPLSVHEIEFYLDTIIKIDEEELIEIMSNCNDFKLVGYNTYALSKWDKYKEIIYDFNIDINRVKKHSNITRRNWEIFKMYELNTEKTTYQKIGQQYSITRERVRQIVGKVKRKVRHHIYKKQFEKYIYFVDGLIIKNGLLCLDYEKHIIQLKEVFGDHDIVEAINLLNFIYDKLIIIDNKYCYQKDKYYRIVNYLDYLVEKLGESFVGIKELNSIYDELRVQKWREKELIKLLINKDSRFHIDKVGNTCYFTKESFDRYCILYSIFNKIDEPVHYSIVMEEYTDIIGEDTNPRLILSYLDRRKDLFVRTFTGTYALREWGYDEHVFTIDLVIELLEEKQCVMHYSDIYEFIKDKTQSKKQTVYTLMQFDDRIASLGCGYYGLTSQVEKNSANLKYYSNIVDEDNKRRLGYLLGKSINKYGNTTITYRVTEIMFNSYCIKIPKVFNIELNKDIHLFDCRYNRYYCKFYETENNLYGINSFFKQNEIEEGEIIILEIISTNVIRIFKKEEYKKKYKTFDSKKYEKYVDILVDRDDEIIEIVDLESLIKFGLKYGFVHYEDLKKVDISSKYDDLFELMADLDERGVRFK